MQQIPCILLACVKGAECGENRTRRRPTRVLEWERPAGSHLVLQSCRKSSVEESWHRRRRRGGGGPCGRAYLGWTVGKGGRGDGGLMTRIMVCPGGGAGHQLPAAHRDVWEGQRQQSVPAGTGERCRRPHRAIEGRRPTAGATESAKTGTGKGTPAPPRSLTQQPHKQRVYKSKAYQQQIMTKMSVTTTSVIPSGEFMSQKKSGDTHAITRTFSKGSQEMERMWRTH